MSKSEKSLLQLSDEALRKAIENAETDLQHNSADKRSDARSYILQAYAVIHDDARAREELYTLDDFGD